MLSVDKTLTCLKSKGSFRGESHSAVKAIKRRNCSVLKGAEEFGVKSVIVCVYFNYRKQKFNTELTFFFLFLLLKQTQQLVQVETHPWVVQQLRVQIQA